MRRLNATIVSLLLAAPVLATPGSFRGEHRGPGGPEDRFERRAERIAELLKLDEAQRAAFDQMLTDGLATAKPKMEQMRALHEELRALLASGSGDAAAIGEKTLAIHQLRDELRAQREAAEAEFVKLLNDEQRFAFEAFQESRQMRREARGRHGGRGFGPGPGGPAPELD